ncbi:PREDICTED: agamous-like MADS-box protein AGL31 isoform X2 [Camelina sativa]|uniref:Agamous-like MADS-box protein AGL31 isoform X2 n=1 Tax=Camelina sativa TaxID=90675 RepID=A0ABM1QNA7_CAMSA|nr:PREDICTED: agamous-like MADS-box protein AGL31 isoform X2 [Camelina sativa]
MGRRKVEIKRIEKKSSRQVTFSKRRNGLIEKARQLSILCESSIAVLVVSGSGKLYNSSSGDNMSKIIDRYEIQHADELKVLDLEEKTRNYLPHKELLDIVQRSALVHLFIPPSSDKKNIFLFLLATYEYRKLEEPVDNVSVDSLMSMEEQLETALSVTRAKKTELMMDDLKSLQETMGMKTILVTEGVGGMSSGNSSGNKIPETLPLLK